MFAALLFALSGCSALIYEIVWFQLLEFVVGSSAISLGILLGVFMGGLCAGSLLVPRFIPREWHPFRVYAVLELGIAALGLLVWLEVPLVGRLYTGSHTHGLWSVTLRAAIAGLCLLPPTILMGATLPAIARWARATPSGISWMSVLYGSNIGGAIVGCLATGFYLLRVHDMPTATFVAAALNAISALLAFALSRARVHRHAKVPEEPRAREVVTTSSILTVTALSGLCALAGQVVWTRVLSLLLGATVYTFSIILAVFLFGLGVGSGLGALLVRIGTNAREMLGACQLLLAPAIAWAAFMANDSLPFWPIAPSLAISPWFLFQLDIARCLWAILPAAILWGASFPLALAAAGSRVEDPARLVGLVYAANTIGAILGAVAFTFLVVPSFGTQLAQQLLVSLSVLAGLIALAPLAWPPWRRATHATRMVLLVGAAILALQAIHAIPPVSPGLIAFGRSLAYRMGAFDPRTNSRAGLPDVLYVGEGVNSSVAVTQDGSTRMFHVSGKIEASTALRDMRLQRMLGHLPALVHSNPRSVLIVGFGAGVTAGTFIQYPGIERIVICEIEPLIPQRIAGYFRNANYGVVDDPRVEIIHDDARHYILTTQEKFDIITSDPIHPWVKGSAALYSLEYFDLVRQHLNPGGVVSQWVPIYQSSEETVKGEFATFFAVFPGGSVWANLSGGEGYDLVLLGGDGDLTVNLDELAARLQGGEHAGVVESLREVGFDSWAGLLSTYAGRDADLKPWTAGARINRDRDLWLQYQAGMESLTEQGAQIFARVVEYRRFPHDLFVGSPERLNELAGDRTQ